MESRLKCYGFYRTEELLATGIFGSDVNTCVNLKVGRGRPVCGLGAHRDCHIIGIIDDPQFVSPHIHVLKC